MVRALALASSSDSTESESESNSNSVTHTVGNNNNINNNINVAAVAQHAACHLIGTAALGDGVVIMVDIDPSGKCVARLANALRTTLGTVPWVVNSLRECASTHHILAVVFTAQGMQCIKIARPVPVGR